MQYRPIDRDGSLAATARPLWQLFAFQPGPVVVAGRNPRGAAMTRGVVAVSLLDLSLIYSIHTKRLNYRMLLPFD